MTIKENIQRILRELPGTVELVVAVKTRSVEEILEAIGGGAKIIGENYVQEAERAYAVIGEKVQWHFIGHLQRNKVKKAVAIFDMIETVDSIGIAREIDIKSRQNNKIMPVLIEINSGAEKNKTGVFPQNVEESISVISKFENMKIVGLMTIGPYFDYAEDSRLYFRQTKILFDHIKGLNLPNVEMKYLSMGMTINYRVAIEEGANIVRIGAKIFGERRIK